MSSLRIALRSFATLAVASSGCLLATAALDVAPARAAEAPRCARTTDAAAPAAPAPGAPCWTEVEPYPFGSDGEAVDLSTKPSCRPGAPGSLQSSDKLECYLIVNSMAFRAWNRGLAATSAVSSDGRTEVTTPYGLWLFNGTRWYPDPTFPGQDVCPGGKVVWAGKLDYWLIGVRPQATDQRPAQRAGNWPTLCRFDGANLEWQPLSVPAATRARVSGIGSPPQTKPGAITSASCLAWDNCWFVGDYGATVHWDGVALTDASPNIAASPWLATDYTAAVARAGGAAGAFGVAVGTTGGPKKKPAGIEAPGALPRRPDRSAPPQMFASSGGAFAPSDFTPPADPQPEDPYRTDLMAADFDSAGLGWVAGVPVGSRAAFRSGNGEPKPGDAERRADAPEPAPLVPISASGAATSCVGPPARRFTFTGSPRGSDAYLWSSLSVFPGARETLAGGQIRPATAGTAVNDDGAREPAIVEAGCDGKVSVTRFRVPDQTAAPAQAPLIPANRGGTFTSVAANASNDAWAATTPGALSNLADPLNAAFEHARLYRLTDARPPKAPAGDDVEPRAPAFTLDPEIFVDEPPLPEPPVEQGATITRPLTKKPKRVKLKAAVYAIDPSQPRALKGSTFILDVRFRVRRPVTIALQGLRRGKVVCSSGLKHFTGKRGKLSLKIDRKHWPTTLRFVAKQGKATSIAYSERRQAR